MQGILFDSGFPGSSGGKEPTHNVGDLGSIPGSGRSPGEGHGNTLQYSYLENPMDRRAWWATVHADTELNMLSDLAHMNTCVSPAKCAFICVCFSCV